MSEIDMSVPEGLRALDLEALVGQSATKAQETIEDAGGIARVVSPGGVVTADYRPNRVTIVVVDGVVTRNNGIG